MFLSQVPELGASLPGTASGSFSVSGQQLGSSAQGSKLIKEQEVRI